MVPPARVPLRSPLASRRFVGHGRRGSFVEGVVSVLPVRAHETEHNIVRSRVSVRVRRSGPARIIAYDLSWQSAPAA